MPQASPLSLEQPERLSLAEELPSWQDELSQMVREPTELFNYLDLPAQYLPQAEAASRLFALRAPRPYLNRIRKGDIDDPLLKQILPLGEEFKEQQGFSQDPLGEHNSTPQPGLVHKYHGRVLLVVAPSCAINCRYCFRRHFPYGDNNPSRQQWLQTFEAIATDSSLREIIFSGGDPLISSDKQLQWMVDQLKQIPHVQRLRVHTRLPVVIPQRITDSCLQWLTGSHLQSVMVLHINHPREIDQQVADSIQILRRAGVTLLNQAVLLKGINDNLHTQQALSEALFAEGVMPYYLHLLDKVQGTAHFAINDNQAIELHQQMQAHLPGFLVPKLAREEAGAHSKTLIL